MYSKGVPVVGDGEVQAAGPGLSAHIGNTAIGVARVDEDLVLANELGVQGQQVSGSLVVLHARGAGGDVQGGDDRGVGQPGIHGSFRTAGVVIESLGVAGAHLEGVGSLHSHTGRGESGAHGGEAGSLGEGAAAVIAAALVVDVVHVEVSDLGLHLGQGGEALGIQGGEVLAC